MTPVVSMAGRKVALFGLGGSGLSTARALQAGGADVIAWDDAPAARDAASAAGVPVADLAWADWSGIAALVLAPGVPLTHPAPHWTVDRAKAAGVEVIGDVELFCRERKRLAPDAPFVAITGTNGKSTTTALTAHLFAAFGREVAMGGNIGTAILDLPPPSPERVHVIECSSYQIDLAPSLAPSMGVLLNLTPDHIDRHGTFEHYAAVKARLVDHAGHAIVGIDDPACAAIAAGLPGATPISMHRATVPGGIGRDGTRLTFDGATLVDLAGIDRLRGVHNAQNAAAAIAALGPLADDRDRLLRALKGFPGLAHRMELLGRAGKVLFVNDSKATNADATEQALRAFEDIFWIAGGIAKDGGIEPLRSLFPRIARAYLVGEAEPAFAATLEGAVAMIRCGTIAVALEHAARDAAASAAREPVVLLSPACASKDQFKSFEARGDAFRALVARHLDPSTSGAAP